MQNLGVYPPLEDPCEDEEEGEEEAQEEKGGEASPARAAGETETRRLPAGDRGSERRRSGGNTGVVVGRGHRPTLKHCQRNCLFLVLGSSVLQIDPTISTI